MFYETAESLRPDLINDSFERNDIQLPIHGFNYTYAQKVQNSDENIICECSKKMIKIMFECKKKTNFIRYSSHILMKQ